MRDAPPGRGSTSEEYNAGVFTFQGTLGRVEIAFTDRHGGNSGGPYASLNLTDRTGDDADAVEENLDLVAHAFARGDEARAKPLSLPAGTRVPVMHGMQQVHGADVAVVDEAGLVRRGPSPVADGLVTRLPGVILLVRAADCVPVLLGDPRAGVVAAVHAGRSGLVAGVVPEALRVMRSLGATQIHAWIGPHACAGCYEVPDEMRAEVCTSVREAYAETRWRTPSLDLGAGVAAQLRRAADVVDVIDASRCTIEDEDLFSYRRQGAESGRLGGLVWVRP